MAQANPFVDIMDDNAAFEVILTNIGLSAEAAGHFIDDYPTFNDLRISDIETIKGVILAQNKIFRHHADANERCYITANQQNYILALHRWSIFAITDAGGRYDVGTVNEFDEDWVRSIVDEYNVADPSPTAQSTVFSVEVPKLTAQNWFDVRRQFLALLATRVGHSGLPLTYLLRDTRLSWEDTEDITPLQERRILTKQHDGHLFDRDNRELHRILLLTFSSTTVEDLVKSEQRTSDGLAAWNKIVANLDGGSYFDELKRQADDIVRKAFFNPNRLFSFEQYFAAHTRAHEMMSAAGAPTAEWKKISDFMNNIQCTPLQHDYRNIKDTPPYNSDFTAFYNKLNENYRMMVQQGIVKPATLNRRRNVSQVDTTRGGRGRGGRGGRGRYNSTNGNRGGRGRGRGRGGRGRGRGNRNRSEENSDGIDLSCLPANFNIQSINDNFAPEVWQGFTWNQRATINALRQMFHTNRQLTINMLEAYRSQNTPQHHHDDMSSIASQAPRFVYGMQSGGSIPPPPPPPPPHGTGNLPIPIPPPPQGSNPFNAGRSINAQASQAGSAFGRPNVSNVSGSTGPGG